MRSHFRAEFCALCHLILWRTERRVVSTQVTTSARKNTTNLIEILNQIRDTDKRKAAIAGFLEERLESEKKLALAEERLESEKKLAEERLKLKLAESEKKLALAEERLKSQKEIHELHAQIANVEILHAKGLLTARGVFERAAHLAFFEMNLKGAVSTTQAVRELGNASKLGVWTQHLRDAAAHCAPKEQTSDLLISVWQELSLDVHGFSWKGPDVQFSASLSEQAKCVVEELCKKMGLKIKKAS
jgi:acyl-CoA hydrolase